MTLVERLNIIDSIDSIANMTDTGKRDLLEAILDDAHYSPEFNSAEEMFDYLDAEIANDTEA